MTKRVSSVASFLAGKARPIGRKGGRGVIGDLTRWLISEREAITQGRAEGRLPWAVVAHLAAADSVVNEDGQPYDRRVMSNAWARLVRKDVTRHTARDVPHSGREAELRAVQSLAPGRISPDPEPAPQSHFKAEHDRRETPSAGASAGHSPQKDDGPPHPSSSGEGRTAQIGARQKSMVGQTGGVLEPMRKRRDERALPEELIFNVYSLNQVEMRQSASGHITGVHNDETAR